MIEERKNICKEIKSVSVNIGESKLIVDCIPVRKTMQKEEFNEESMIKQILETEASFLIYLTDSEDLLNNDDEGRQ